MFYHMCLALSLDLQSVYVFCGAGLASGPVRAFIKSQRSAPVGHKIATCCYCGTRAALVLDKGRHELSCASCGAPLHEIKSIPCHKLRSQPVKRKNNQKGKKSDYSGRSYEKYSPKRYVKKRKSLGRKVLSELWDVVEDILD